MNTINLDGCTTRPLGSYLKALGVLRLISEQADPETRGWWEGDTFHLRSRLSEDELMRFFLEEYRPTPILAPWNGASGFYEKDSKDGIDAIASSMGERFAEYRLSISLMRDLEEVKRGASTDVKKEDERRSAILISARNVLPDAAVDWLDAAMAVGADYKRSFPPVLGTGGNEGHLDYSNNFMGRLAELLVAPAKRSEVNELLANSLFGWRTSALQKAAVGQFDPGRAGGFNQGEGIENKSLVNAWDFVLTMEGAVAWASGLYRRQGTRLRSFLCSPFTVRASTVGYGSSAAQDEARAEIWTPIWSRAASYRELKVLLREGRASVDERPATNGIQFAEAACSLGVDRGIDGFVRYSLLKRRGDSYVALPAGQFPTGYRSEGDRIRELRPIIDRIDAGEIATSGKDVRRKLDNAIFEALLRGGPSRVKAVVSALGSMLRWFAVRGKRVWTPAPLDPDAWIEACGGGVEVRIAAALSSIYDVEAGGVREQLFGTGPNLGWTGQTVAERMTNTIEARARLADSKRSQQNPFAGAFVLDPGDTTLFIEGATDDESIQDLLFGFTCLKWQGYRQGRVSSEAEAMPVYQLLKHLFLPSPVRWNGEEKRLRYDPRVVSLLRAGRVADAAEVAIHRLRAAGLNPVDAEYEGGVDASRLAAALLIPVRVNGRFSAAILNDGKTELIHE